MGSRDARLPFFPQPHGHFPFLYQQNFKNPSRAVFRPVRGRRSSPKACSVDFHPRRSLIGQAVSSAGRLLPLKFAESVKLCFRRVFHNFYPPLPGPVKVFGFQLFSNSFSLPMIKRTITFIGTFDSFLKLWYSRMERLGKLDGRQKIFRNTPPRPGAVPAFRSCPGREPSFPCSSPLRL